MISLVFFGSFQHYSVLTLSRLHHHPKFKISAVVTTPPRPGNRGQIQTTAVHRFCLENNLPAYPLENLSTVPASIKKPDFIIVAGFGQLLNLKWLNFPKIMAVNLHSSLLPRYAGRFPAEWAILRNESKTGVTLIKMSPEFDAGDIIAQKTIPILSADTRETLYQKLYTLGADLVISTLSRPIHPRPQPKGKFFYARQLTRDHGFIPWKKFVDPQNQVLLSTLFRALFPWPGVWTITPQNKRLKILSLSPLTIQLEGKTPKPFRLSDFLIS
jgi:methionyl-tRNA formyltransferase